MLWQFTCSSQHYLSVECICPLAHSGSGPDFNHPVGEKGISQIPFKPPISYPETLPSTFQHPCYGKSFLLSVPPVILNNSHQILLSLSGPRKETQTIQSLLMTENALSQAASWKTSTLPSPVQLHLFSSVAVKSVHWPIHYFFKLNHNIPALKFHATSTEGKCIMYCFHHLIYPYISMILGHWGPSVPQHSLEPYHFFCIF